MRPELRVTTMFWHSPSNAHTYRLLIFKELCCPAADLRRLLFSTAELFQRRPRL